MKDNIIIIIPTHKRQHYLNRVASYYSHFDMKVYICDSTPGEAFNIDQYNNINYIWCPEKTFCTKILHVLNTTDARFYATSPDDDFLVYETLMECYNRLQNDKMYSMAIGRQCYFYEKFKNDAIFTNIYSNRLYRKKIDGNKFNNSIKFWSNYQNILWTLFTKDTLLDAFETLERLNYDSQNFIELTIGMKAISHGKIYVSKKYLNCREESTAIHWGNLEKVVSISNFFKYKSMRKDMAKFWNSENTFSSRIGFLCYLFVSSNRIIEKVRALSLKWLNRGKVTFSIDDTKLSSRISNALSHV